jgi:FO synthase
MHGMFEPDAAARQLDAVDAASRRILDRALGGAPLDDPGALHLIDGPAPLAALLAVAGAVRTRHKGRLVTYSPKVFLPITNLCLDRCSYCTFRQEPESPAAWTMLPEEVRDWSRRGRALGCVEALMCLGDKPERAYKSYRRTLAVLGCDTTIDYVARCCELALDEGLLPHTNAGVMTGDEMARLRPLNVSMGLMLESTSRRLRQRGGAHQQAPDKEPALRLAMLERAGALRIPFTTGILIGIGETRAERVTSLRAIADLHAAHGHIQEVIIQNFRAKPSTRMAAAPEPESAEMARTIAVARLMMPAMNIQAPPNLSPLDHRLFLAAGINDWGGISPLTLDYVNPEAPWPQVQALAETCRAEGFTLVPRLPVYDEYLDEPGWLDAGLRQRVHSQRPDRGARHVG